MNTQFLPKSGCTEAIGHKAAVAYSYLLAGFKP
jgi:hypothetical protein